MVKHKNELILYHGTNTKFDVIDMDKSLDKRDFGKGFYSTILEKQAFRWANNICSRRKEGVPSVLKFKVKKFKSLKIKEFTKVNIEWLKFVKQNRTLGGVAHEYDIVIGPIADDDTRVTIELYSDGLLSANDAMRLLKNSKPDNQVSFHTKRAIEFIEFEEWRQYESKIRI